MTITRAPLRLGIAAALTVSIMFSGCSNGGSESEGGDVASLEEGTDADAGSNNEGDPEQELIDYVACLREQGLDVPDPEVDADGNLQLRPGGGPGGPGGGDGDGAGIDRDAFVEAQEVCGDVPTGALGFRDGDDSERQDRFLEYAQCMRDEGIDMEDPDFSGTATPGEGGGPFGDLDREDPDFVAANEVCQALFGEDGLGEAPGTGE